MTDTEGKKNTRGRRKQAQNSDEAKDHTCPCSCKDLLETMNSKLDQALAATAQIDELKERQRPQKPRTKV